ncbi:hypothetical protein GDO86_015654, partial [Hymenochirus boettgeri]
GCPHQCECPVNATCTPETNKILDTCGCGCEVCVQEQDSECNGLRPCNPVRNLSCVYPDVHVKQGVCKGVNCTYWKCNEEANNYLDRIDPQWDMAVPIPDPKTSSLDVRKRKRREAVDTEDAVPVTKPTICNVPPTEWTPCSRSCGFGQSVRIRYEKWSCTPRAEKRICMIRPCKSEYPTANYTLLKTTKNCNRLLRWSEPLTMNHRGCYTQHPLRPRFCGLCSDGRDCFPSHTETRPVSFHCSHSNRTHSNRNVTRQFMWLMQCKCRVPAGKIGKEKKWHKKRVTKPEKNDIEGDLMGREG